MVFRSSSKIVARLPVYLGLPAIVVAIFLGLAPNRGQFFLGNSDSAQLLAASVTKASATTGTQPPAYKISDLYGTWKLVKIVPAGKTGTSDKDIQKTFTKKMVLQSGKVKLFQGKVCKKPSYGPLTTYPVEPGKKTLPENEDLEIHSMYVGYGLHRTSITEFRVACAQPHFEVNFEVITKKEMVLLWNMKALVFKR